MRNWLMAVVVAALGLSSGTVWAEPIQVTSGMVFHPGSGLISSFTFMTTEWRVSGRFENGPPVRCSPCLPGETLAVRDFHSSGLSSSGPGRIGDVEYALLFPRGIFTFSVSPLVLPFDESPFFSIVTPFSVSSQMRFRIYDRPPDIMPPPPLIDTLIFGHGTATFTFRTQVIPGGLLYSLFETTYQFSPQPIPEPTSLALLTGGLFGLTAARRRKRRRS